MSQSRPTRPTNFQVEGLESRKLMTSNLGSITTIQVLGQVAIPGTQDVLKVENLVTTSMTSQGGRVSIHTTTTQRDEILGNTPVTVVAVPGHPGALAILPSSSPSVGYDNQVGVEQIYENHSSGARTIGSTTVSRSDAFFPEMTFLTPTKGTTLNVHEDIGGPETFPSSN